MNKKLLFAVSLITNFAFAQIHENGGLSTGATSINGTAAPAGYTWSELQNDTGNTAETNITLGIYGTYVSTGIDYFLADDFTIPVGEQWQITSIDFFAYQTGYTGTTSPFDKVRVNIFSSDPSVAGAVSVFGDDTTNRFIESIDAKMYRVVNSSVPSNVNPGTTRKIWKITANTPVTLPAGTYWIKYQIENIVTANGGFLPPVTIKGSRGLPNFNSKEFNKNTGVWVSSLDRGKPSTAPDFPLDMPFIITYTKNTLGANEVLQYDNRIQVYPNPAKDLFKINIPETLEVDAIEIIDMSGKLIRKLKVSDDYNVSDLPKGNYMLRIKSKEITKVTKLIKN